MEATSDLHSRAWVPLAEDEGKSPPRQFALKRAEGMKNDQVCSSAYKVGGGCIRSYSVVQSHSLCSFHAIGLKDPCSMFALTLL